MALNGILSFPLPVEVRGHQGSVFAPVLVLIFLNIFHILYKILLTLILMTPPSAVSSLILQIDRQQPLPTIETSIETGVGRTLGMCLSTLTNLQMPLSFKRTVMSPPIYFLNKPLEEVQSFKLSDLNLSTMILLGKPHIEVGLQSQPPSEHPLLCSLFLDILGHLGYILPHLRHTTLQIFQSHCWIFSDIPNQLPACPAAEFEWAT